MKICKKIIMLGISLMLVLIIFTGCITQENNKQIIEIQDPVFSLKGFVFDSFFIPFTDYPNTNDSMMSFDLIIDNPNNDSVEIQVLICHIMDYSGNTLLSFKPEICQFMNYYNALTTTSFTLDNNQNVTLHHYKVIDKNSTSTATLDYLKNPSNNLRISGLYMLNGELQWFESNLCEINITI